MDLSIVIPVWNERGKIGRDVAAAADFFGRRRMSGELIVSDDGSSDGTADEAVRAGRIHGVPLRVIRLPHRGKGSAVRSGMLAASGRVAGFMDSGLCVPFDDAWTGIRWILDGECEIAHGSRRLAESVILRPANPVRRLASRCFGSLAGRLFDLPSGLTDTQAGCKFYDAAAAAALYAACRSDGFVFDLEILALARRAGYRVREFPVTWTSDPDSRLSLIRSLPALTAESAGLMRRMREEPPPETASGRGH
jgi:dolichyl-phosphate beta-glucosyltransferase